MKHIMKLSSLTLILAATACTSTYAPRVERGDFWQRTDAASQIYLRGPKAQHTLNHDIANCVAEIKELDRLGSLRQVTPPDTQTSRSDGAPLGGATSGYDTPQYDGANYAAYYEYADFEGCMKEKGWQRMEYVPYQRAKEGREVFSETVFGPNSQYSRDHDGKVGTANDDFDDLNQ